MPTPLQKEKPDGSFYYVYVTSGAAQLEYREIVDDSGANYRERVSDDDFEVTRVLECRWDKRFVFYNEMLGTAQRTHDGSGHIQRTLPEPHPQVPGMYCVAMELIKGVGRPDIDLDQCIVQYADADGDFTDVANLPPAPVIRDPSNANKIKNYGRARFATTWRKLNYNVLSDDVLATTGSGTVAAGSEFFRYMEKLPSDYAGQNLPLPIGVFKWVTPDPVTGAHDPLGQGINKTYYTREITYCWRKVPGIPETGIVACLGKVNDDVFDGYPAGTLLFEAPQILRKQTWRTEQPPPPYYYDCFYKMLYRPEGHNKYYRASIKAFDDFSVDGTNATTDGNRLHDKADFLKLFKLLDADPDF